MLAYSGGHACSGKPRLIVPYCCLSDGYDDLRRKPVMQLQLTRLITPFLSLCFSLDAPLAAPPPAPPAAPPPALPPALPVAPPAPVSAGDTFPLGLPRLVQAGTLGELSTSLRRLGRQRSGMHDTAGPDKF